MTLRRLVKPLMSNQVIGLNKMGAHVIRTHLRENPEVVFYYKGTAKEQGVSLALNTIAALDLSDAHIFIDRSDARSLCQKLNLDKSTLLAAGYTEFEVIDL